MKKAIPTIVVGIAVVFLLIYGSIAGWLGEVTSNKAGDLYQVLNLVNSSNEHLSNMYGAILLDDKLVDERAIVQNDLYYMRLEYVQTQLDSRFFWDDKENLLLYTMPEGTDRYEEDDPNIYIDTSNDSRVVYISVNLVTKYTGVEAKTFTNPCRVLLTKNWGTKYKTVVLTQDAKLRQKDTNNSDILKNSTTGDKFTVLKDEGDWTKVITDDGITGYLENIYVQAGDSITITRTEDFQEPVYKGVSYDGKVSLAFHGIWSIAANEDIANTLAGTKSVNVLAPTWFVVSSSKGEITSLASEYYVQAAHEEGKQVWAMLDDFSTGSTNEDGKRYITSLLPYTSRREMLISNIMNLVDQYNLDGINVDFEYITEANGENYIQFIRELSVALHQKGKILSIDNYVSSSWTSHYNRKEEVAFGDYLCIMSYDEHNASSDSAGSVASISFVKQGIADTIAEVGEEQSGKLINAVPFYTRLWIETPEDYADEDAKVVEDSTNGKYALSSQAISISDANFWINNRGLSPNWLDDMGQDYYETQDGVVTYRLWMEDAKSIDLKMNCMNEYNLGGSAYWALNYNVGTEVWDVIENAFQNQE